MSTPTAQLDRRHARLLAMETATAIGHTSTLTVLDATAAPHRLDAALLRAEVAARLEELPMLRRSLVEVPFGLDRPWWRDHPEFDLNYHLRHIAVPDADDPEALTDLVARIHSRPLDRGRPLWELYLITGLADGRAALLFKMHLAALGEGTGHEIDAGLIGPTPDLRSVADAADNAEARWWADDGPSWWQILARTSWNTCRDPVRTLRTVPRGLVSLPGLRAVLHPALALTNQRAQRSIVIAEQSGITPRTSFNGRIGPHRRWATAELDRRRIAAIRERCGVSTVDVVTSVCGGALRWWLLQHDELPREPLRALVPLSVTDPNVVDGIAGVVVSLETHAHQVTERIGVIHDQIGQAVRRHGAMTATEIRGIGGSTPLLGTIASRLLAHSPISERLMPPFNMTLTSVPGPDGPRWALGAPVEAIYPILGIADGMGLHIGTMSVGNRLCLSLVADRDQIADLADLAARLPVELDELEAAAGSY